MTNIHLRPVREADAPALAAIYAPYVRETAITFEYEPPDAAEFRRRIAAIAPKYPYLVAERDGQVLGYAYTGPLRTRAAYGWTAETSIYLRRDLRGNGLGQRFYRALEELSPGPGRPDPGGLRHLLPDGEPLRDGRQRPLPLPSGL